MAEDKIRVLIVEDEPLFRDMLRIALGNQPRLEVVGTVADGESAIRAADQLKPHVVLTDIELEAGLNGIAAGHRIKSQHPQMGIVILSMHRDKQYIASLPDERAGGWSYLLKQSVADAATLARAIEGSAAGLVVMDPAIVHSLRPKAQSELERLSPRLREVLELMAQGYNNAAIAQKLVVSEKSIENYINTLFQELGISREGESHPRVKAILKFLGQTQSG